MKEQGEQVDIDKNDVFIIHSVSCVCTRNDKGEEVERLSSINESKNCKYFTDYVLQFVRPRIIVSMGATALNQYLPNSILKEYIGKIVNFNGKGPHPKTQIITLKTVKELYPFMEDIEYKIEMK